ncbi:hypothetical protein SO802_000644 [Lithocarpus litseifolius]|uniref:GH18 domain-containing protein n=1 Tax=Lithocarpus litseifolius TaxID=425828 RepID=A0AAW2DS39_9ROSI
MASKTLPYIFSTLLFLLQLQFSAGQTEVKAAYWFPGTGLSVSGIDSTLFTHLFCAIADLDQTTYQVTISSSNSAEFSTFTQTVQQKNPSVKTLLSIGGGDAVAPTFASMASQASTRKSFIDSSIQLASWSTAPNLTGAPAALYNPTSQVSGDSGIAEWIQAGVSAKKLVLGVPFYGYA